MTTWLPNIVCTVGGIILSGLIGFWQGKRAARVQDKHTRMLTTSLTNEEQKGNMELARDKDGNITGGRVIRLQGSAISSSIATGDLTTAPASPALPQGPETAPR